MKKHTMLFSLFVVFFLMGCEGESQKAISYRSLLEDDWVSERVHLIEQMAIKKTYPRKLAVLVASQPLCITVNDALEYTDRYQSAQGTFQPKTNTWDLSLGESFEKPLVMDTFGVVIVNDGVSMFFYLHSLGYLKNSKDLKNKDYHILKSLGKCYLKNSYEFCEGYYGVPLARFYSEKHKIHQIVDCGHNDMVDDGICSYRFSFKDNISGAWGFNRFEYGFFESPGVFEAFEFEMYDALDAWYEKHSSEAALLECVG